MAQSFSSRLSGGVLDMTHLWLWDRVTAAAGRTRFVYHKSFARLQSVKLSILAIKKQSILSADES